MIGPGQLAAGPGQIITLLPKGTDNYIFFSKFNQRLVPKNCATKYLISEKRHGKFFLIFSLYIICNSHFCGTSVILKYCHIGHPFKCNFNMLQSISSVKVFITI